jgi:DNA ligase D-like protein (predicted polymerase)
MSSNEKPGPAAWLFFVHSIHLCNICATAREPHTTFISCMLFCVQSFMLIRKNTKAFKTILEIVNACQTRPDREKLIRVYITKAGQKISDRISVESIQSDAGLFYELNFQAVLNNLRSSNHQLNQSDDVPGIYFFHSSSNKVWDETPFEFDEAVKKEFASLPELPLVRKKEKAGKFVLPAPTVKSEPKVAKKQKKVDADAKKKIKAPEKGPKQPGYKLKRKIHFTELDKIIFRQPRLSKQDILDYYNEIADHILPYLKDRPLAIRTRSDGTRTTDHIDLATLTKNDDEIPEWIQAGTGAKSRQKESVLICNDKEHLLFYVEKGAVEFVTCHSRNKSAAFPDYLVIAIESPESDLNKTAQVAREVNIILSGLQLPSFVLTNGLSALHIYVPLDAKSTFAQSKAVAEYICKLIRLKIPDLVTIESDSDYSYGKVSLDYRLNEEDKFVTAPYSIQAIESPAVATPLLWEEVNDDLRLDFNHENIFKRLKKMDDPFEKLSKKKINAEALLEKIEENYSFLF